MDGGRPRSSSTVCQTFLHFELGVAVLVADLLDVEVFMNAVSFGDHDKHPAFRIHGLQPEGSVPEFSWCPLLTSAMRRWFPEMPPHRSRLSYAPGS